MKNVFKLLTSFVLAVMLLSCEAERTATHSGKRIIDSKNVSLQQFLQETRMSNFESSIHLESNLQNKTANGGYELTDFDIDTDIIKKMEYNQKTTYSLVAVPKDTLVENYFNLIYYKNGTTWEKKIIEMKPTPDNLIQLKSGLTDDFEGQMRMVYDSKQSKSESCSYISITIERCQDCRGTCDQCSKCITTNIYSFCNPGAIKFISPTPSAPSGFSGGDGGGGGANDDPNEIVIDPNLANLDFKKITQFLTNLRTTDTAAYTYLTTHPEIKNQVFRYLGQNDFSEESTIFASELIEDMINFPISEGNDGDAPDFNYDYYSNVQTQTQSLPNRNDFYNVFPKIGTSGMPAFQVYQLIGGTVYNSRTNNPDSYQNACALRVSRALNYSGNPIPVFYNNARQQRTQKGADNLNYILDAASLLAYMKKTFPNSNPVHLVNKTPTEFKSAINGKRGIYIMLPKNTATFNASGHADFWSNTGCLSGCHLEDAKEIYFWELF